MKVGDYVRYKDIFKNEIAKIRKLNKIIPPDEIKEILIKDFNEILVKEFCTDWKEKR